MVICKYFLRGTCRFGESCRNEHAYAETSTSVLRKKGEIDPNVLIKSVSNDMDKAEKGNQWPLSCYGPFPARPCFPGFDDKCFEEIRLGIYEAEKNGTVEQYKQYLTQLLHEARSKTQSLQNPTAEAGRVLLELYNTNVVEQQTPNVFASANAFGNSQIQSNSVFSNSGGASKNIFGNRTTTPSFKFALSENKSLFGIAAPSTNSNSIFGQSNLPHFPSAGNNIFGGQMQNQNSFSTSSIFENTGGASYNQNVFGTQQPTVINQSPFNGAQSAQHSSNIFIVNNQPPNPFKQNMQPSSTGQSPFGSSAVLQTPFGTLATNQSAFGVPGTNQSAFGPLVTNQPTFGSQVPSQPIFGSPVPNQPTFGSPVINQTPTFGTSVSNQTQSIFGTVVPNQTPPTFGTQVPNQKTPTFGTPVPNQTQSTFGVPVPNQAQTVFGALVPNQAQPTFVTPVPNQAQPAFVTPVSNTTPPTFVTPVSNTTPPTFVTQIPNQAQPTFGSMANQVSVNQSAFGTPPFAATATNQKTFYVANQTSFGAPAAPVNSSAFAASNTTQAAYATKNLSPFSSSATGTITENRSIFAQKGLTGQNVQTNSLDHTKSIFGSSKPTTIAPITLHDEPTTYSKLENLKESDVKCFEASTFEFGKIPDKPPTLQMCT